MTPMLLRLHRHDEQVLHLLVGARRHRGNTIMRAVTHLGDAAVTIGLVLALIASRSPALVAAGAAAAFTLVVSHLWVQLLKRSVHRARPRLPVGTESLIAAPDRFSFPSGHAAASLSIALALGSLTSVPVAAVLVALALLVGTSRCYLGVHYPGDVVVGWLLALAAHRCAPLFLQLLGG